MQNKSRLLLANVCFDSSTTHELKQKLFSNQIPRLLFTHHPFSLHSKRQRTFEKRKFGIDSALTLYPTFDVFTFSKFHNETTNFAAIVIILSGSAIKW